MASDPHSPQRARRRTIGAVLLVVVAFAIALKLRARHSQETDAGPPAPGPSLPGVASAEPGPAPSAPRAIAHYVSALLPAGTRVLALSSGSGTAIAVGERGAVLRYALDRAEWKPDPPVTDRTLRAVAQQLDRAVAVGDDGTILELAGGAWSAAPSPTTRALRAVAYSAYGVVAAGDGGTIVTRLGEGQPWRLEPTVTQRDLFGACAGLRDLWIVGAGGAIVLRGPSGFASAPPVTESALYAVACDDHAGTAVGARGTILERLDDVGWHEVPSNTQADLFAVAAPVGGRSFLAVGAGGTILHVTQDVAAEPQSVGWTLRAATEGALGTWVGGDEGLLRRATD